MILILSKKLFRDKMFWDYRDFKGITDVESVPTGYLIDL